MKHYFNEGKEILKSDDYQGRSKKQVENNELAAFVSVIGLILCVIGIAINNMLS